MKRASATTLALLILGCGAAEPVHKGTGDKPARAGASAGNEPPVISSIEMVPAAPGSTDPISLAIAVSDPDQRRVGLSVEWYRNDVLEADLTETSVDPGTFARGDRVYALVTASDGANEVSAESPTVVIANAAPLVTKVRLEPQNASAVDMIIADATVEDADGDPTELSYRWTINGAPVPEATSSRLSPGLGKRGDRISVSVSATDGSDASRWTGSTALLLANSAPRITTQPNFDLAGKGQAEYRYAVAAEDPDGDAPLRYELVTAPAGMTVEVVSGVVTWRVPANASGKFPIELVVSDAYGGRTTQSYALSVEWSGDDAAAAKKKTTGTRTAKPKTTPAKRALDSQPAAADSDSEDGVIEADPAQPDEQGPSEESDDAESSTDEDEPL